MKKLMKKLAALALTGAMVLSLGVSALATTNDATNLEDPANPVTGTMGGTGTFETLNLQKPVKVTVPTNVATLYDMILDPHGLIQETEAGAFPTGTTFDYGTTAAPNRLFFSTGTNKYAPTSKPLTIINKGFDPVKVSAELTINKQADTTKATDAIAIVNSAAALATEKAPAMYMALVTGNGGDSGTAITSKPAKEEGVQKVNGVISAALATSVTGFEWDDGSPQTIGTNDNDTVKAQKTAYNEALAEILAEFKAKIAVTPLVVTVTAKQGDDFAYSVAKMSGFHFSVTEAAAKGTIAVNYDDGSEDGIDVGEITLAHVAKADAPSTAVTDTVTVKYGNFVYDSACTTTPASSQKIVSGATIKFAEGLKQAPASATDTDPTMDDIDTFLATYNQFSFEIAQAAANVDKNLAITAPTVPANANVDFEFVKVGRSLTATTNYLDEPEAKTVVYNIVPKSEEDVLATVTFTLVKSVEEQKTEAFAADTTETVTLALSYNESKKATSEIVGSLASVPGNFKKVGKEVDGVRTYSYEELTSTDEGYEEFKKATFYLTGNINDAESWDGAEGNTVLANAIGNNLKMEVVWNVNTLEDGETFTDTLYDANPPENRMPSATVTTKGEFNGDAIVVKVDLGEGNDAVASFAKITYSGGEDVGATPVDGKTDEYTFSLTKLTAKAKGINDWKVVFNNAAGKTPATVEVDIDIYTAS